MSSGSSSTGSAEQDSASFAHAAADEPDHAYFFLGNCQMQYLCSIIGRVSPARRYFMGHPFNVNVTLDGAQVPYVRRRHVLEGLSRVKARGGRSILLVQETSRRLYQERIKKWSFGFTDILRVPHLHFHATWPQLTLGRPAMEATDREIRRVFDWERHEFSSKLATCGVRDPSFEAAFWDRNKQSIRFFHPGHPTGEVFAEVLEALGPEFSSRLPCFGDLVRALRPSMGIYQTCMHPIPASAAAALGVEWAQTDFYRALVELKQPRAEPEQLRAAVARGVALLDDEAAMGEVPWPMRSHFRAAIALANLKLDRRRQALPHILAATIRLKGYHPYLRITLNQAVRLGRNDIVEKVLIKTAPYVHPFTSETAGMDASIRSLLTHPDGRQVLARVQERTDPGSWVHGYIRNIDGEAKAGRVNGPDLD